MLWTCVWGHAESRCSGPEVNGPQFLELLHEILETRDQSQLGRNEFRKIRVGKIMAREGLPYRLQAFKAGLCERHL